MPTILGVVSIAYNLPTVGKLQLDGTTLANIYLGKIKSWDDAAIAAQNSGVTLPSKPIMLTFDDTDEDQYTVAFPEMKKITINHWSAPGALRISSNSPS